MTDPRAGQPAQPSDLVDVASLVTAYYTLRTRPGRTGPAGGVRHLGPPRVQLRRRVQRGAHPGDHAGHLRVPGRAGLRRAAVRRPRHPRAVRAGLGTALEVLVANDVDRAGGLGRRLHPDAGGQPRHPDRQPREVDRPRRRHRRHPLAQPAARRRLQVQPAERRAGRHRRDRLDRRPRQRPAARAGWAASGGCPSTRRAAAAGRATTSSAPTSTTCRTCSTSTRSARRACGSAPTRWAARASTTGARSPSATAST